MVTILLLSSACGLLTPPEPQPRTPAAALDQPQVPNLPCPPETQLESGSSPKGQEYFCQRDGELHGAYLRYHPEPPDGGELVKGVSGSYQNGKEHGNWTWWYEDGTPMAKGKYNVGKQTGAWTWWHEGGSRKEEGDFIQGRRQGQWTTYFESGRKSAQGMYHNGMRQGSWVFYDDDQENSLARTEIYENDQLMSEKVVNKK